MQVNARYNRDQLHEGRIVCCVQLSDGRQDFTRWWLTELKSVKFPTAGTLFDYYIDPETRKFEPWTRKVPKFEFDPDQPLQVKDAFSRICFVAFFFCFFFF